MMKTENVKGTYIPSIDAEDIYNVSVRGLEDITRYKYTGMIPYSLELIKLRSYKRDFAEKEIIRNKKAKNPKSKFRSDAVINVKFKKKLKDGSQFDSFVRDYDILMNNLISQFKSLKRGIRNTKLEIEQEKNKREKDKLIKKLSFLEDSIANVKGHFKRIKAEYQNEETKGKYEKVSDKELRIKLYTEGFTFKGNVYKFYKRTASKSRQSQCLFILEDLHERMMEWSHMGLDLSGKIDVASLLAYNSLVSSSLEDTIVIDPDSIFIIDDKFSTFECEGIEVNKTLTATFNKNATIENNIWDGQGLMDVSLFKSIGKGHKGMALLRQHFFKSCMFNTNIQDFLKDNCPEGVNYDEWKLADMFGNKILAKDILVLTTPSSLKFFKYTKGNEKKAFANWKKRVKKDKNVFGICKNEKESKYGNRSYTSYQMINTLSADMDDVKRLAKFEVDFIKSLQGTKNEDGTFNEQPFINYLDKKQELTNAYAMLADMYRVNPDATRLQMFRDYRKKQISNYRTKVKGGKLRLISDYSTVVSNPYEMLEAMLEGKKADRSIKEATILKGYEMHTTLHDFNKEYTLVRNPFNAMHNFNKAMNVDHEVFTKYFNFTKNIVVFNAIKNPVLDRNNGLDMDSDTVLIFADSEFNKIVDKTLAQREYPVILNRIKSDNNPLEFTNENIAQIDLNTGVSQMWIGEVTNAAQHQVSLLWDTIHNEEEGVFKNEKINNILDNISILVVLSNVAIDYSKKVVKVDVDGALKEMRKSYVTKNREFKTTRNGIKEVYKNRPKPSFWKYVSSSDVSTEDYDCPMDYLAQHINNDIEKAAYRKNISLSNLISGDMKGADDKQIKDINKLIEEFDKKLKKINSGNSDEKCMERKALLEDTYDELDSALAKKTIKKATMYKILTQVSKTYDVKGKKGSKTNDYSGIVVHLMNALYRTHTKTFLNLFKK